MKISQDVREYAASKGIGDVGVAIEQVAAMINMDMVGRLRNNTVSVLGAESAEEWNDVVQPLCDALQLNCKLGGDGYGPSDQTPFYAAGVPVLHLFTGAHEEYHKPADDAHLINATGGAQIANLAADIAFELSSVEGLTYKKSEAPAPLGDVRSYGASLGTIPDYTGAPDDKPGMFDLVGRAKYDAWSKLKGKSTDEAMQGYVDLVKRLG